MLKSDRSVFDMNAAYQKIMRLGPSYDVAAEAL